MWMWLSCYLCGCKNETWLWFCKWRWDAWRKETIVWVDSTHSGVLAESTQCITVCNHCASSVVRTDLTKDVLIKLIRLFDKSIPSAGAHCGTNLKLCSLTSVWWRTVALMDNCVACCIWLQLATTLAFHFHNGWDISGYCRRRSVFLNVDVVHKFVEVFYGSSVESVSSHA